MDTTIKNKSFRLIELAGIVSLLLSCVMTCCLLLPSFLLSRQLKGETETAVVLLSGNHVDIPHNDFHYLFSRMGLAFVSVPSDSLTAESAAGELERISSEQGYAEVILMAGRGHSALALEAAAVSERVSGVLLFSPDVGLAEDFARPAVPVGIFDGKNPETIRFYELLSGEDASLWSGQEKSGLLPRSTFVAPSGQQFMTIWDSIGPNSFFGVFLPFFPGFQMEVSGFISFFILGGGEAAGGYASYVFFVHSLKVLAIVFLLVGILLSLFGLRARRVKRPQLLRGAAEELPIAKAGVFFRKKNWAVRVGTLLFSVLAAIVLVLDRRYFVPLLAVWPVVFFLLQLLFGFGFFARPIRSRPLSGGERGLLLLTGILVPVSILLVKAAGLFTVSIFVGTERLVLYVGLGGLFLIGRFLLSRLLLFFDAARVDFYGKTILPSGGEAVLLSCVPYVTALVLGLSGGDTESAVAACVILVVFLFHQWAEGIFRRATGSAVWTVVFSGALFWVFL